MNTQASTSNPAFEWSALDQQAVDVARALAVDAVERAGHGHPGTAMSLAPAAYLLFQRLLRHDPAAPRWTGRDRFVLSCGHSSLTLYTQLYLSGHGLELDDLKALRTEGSLTPAHPEYGHTPGVETTTGPLGQGLGNAVGMAMAARRERGLFDPDAAPGTSPFDHTVWVFASDGDLEEGISHEVGSLAGHQKLGAAEAAAAKAAMGLDPEASFQVPAEVLAHARGAADRGRAARAQWDKRYQDWRAARPEHAALFDRVDAKRLPEGWSGALPQFTAGGEMATRKASGEVLNALASVLPELWGGSADLAESNNATMKGEPSFVPSEFATRAFPGHPYGRTLHFGIREHGMGAVLNGIALHGGTRPYGGTFLVFSDYMRPAVRLAAMMKLPVTYVWTHDSIGLGEDGPTHQPVEHLWSLRAIPGLDVVRPADANETAAAWRAILERDDRPAGLCLTRQNVPVLPDPGAESVVRGGYVRAEAEGAEPEAVVLATGSEVHIALAARALLQQGGIPTRVVSLPCLEWFAEQPPEYRDSVLPPRLRARVSVEAGSTLGWPTLIGEAGEAVGIDTFGASAPYQSLYEKHGLTPERVAAAVRRSIARAAVRSAAPASQEPSPKEGSR